MVEAVPPPHYGGTERIVSYLTEELVSLGHDVTLFASGDSRTSATLAVMCPRALRTSGCADYLPQHMLQLGRVIASVEEFDVIHFHTDFVHLPLGDRLPVPCVTTLHGRLDAIEVRACLTEYRRQPFVSISHHQRIPVPWLNWRATVYHGLPPDLYRFSPRGSDYLAFVGRISPEKRVDRAIEIAGRAGVRLVIGAKVDPRDRDYFESVKGMLGLPHVEFVGEVGDDEKQQIIGGAAGLLFPIDWPEPFGMVVVEAFACGTPVIAYAEGAMPELIDHGLTGFLAGSIEEGVRAVEGLDAIDRRRCRDVFDQRFSASRMTGEYVDVYEHLIMERSDADAYSRFASAESAQRPAGT